MTFRAVFPHRCANRRPARCAIRGESAELRHSGERHGSSASTTCLGRKRFVVERVKGIEPSSSAWKTVAGAQQALAFHNTKPLQLLAFWETVWHSEATLITRRNTG
jgi:hypothetical protein